MQENIIEVRSVRKRFRERGYLGGGFLSDVLRPRYKLALDNVSFAVRRGDIVALLGRNGSGKSTLVKILSGILFPDSGSARVLGLDPWASRKTLARRLGVVLGAHGQLYWNLPAIDTFNFMRDVYRINDADYRQRLEHFIDVLSLKDVYKRQVRQLSLGEQMKCNFVASVLHAPELVFLDEPTIGVDLPSKLALRDAILEMQRSHGTTFLITTHIVEDISVVNRVLLLSRGRLVFDGSRRSLELMFGNKRHVELRMARDSDGTDYRKFGRVLERRSDFVRLEVSGGVLKDPRFIRLLTDRNVIDYRISEPGLAFVLGRFYRMMERSEGGGR